MLFQALLHCPISTRYPSLFSLDLSHTGTDLKCSQHHLTPDTEYNFIVTALTNEGKFESKATKKRTAKDECKISTFSFYLVFVCFLFLLFKFL